MHTAHTRASDAVLYFVPIRILPYEWHFQPSQDRLPLPGYMGEPQGLHLPDLLLSCTVGPRLMLFRARPTWLSLALLSSLIRSTLAFCVSLACQIIMRPQKPTLFPPPCRALVGASTKQEPNPLLQPCSLRGLCRPAGCVRRASCLPRCVYNLEQDPGIYRSLSSAFLCLDTWASLWKPASRNSCFPGQLALAS